MSWAIYQKRRRKITHQARVPRVSVNKRYEIAMNFAAWDKLGAPLLADLWYDRKTKRIGVVLPFEDELENSFRVRKYGRSRGRVIRATKFFKENRIRVTKTVSITNPRFESGGMLVIGMRDEG